jgi:hypothetical protein
LGDRSARHAADLTNVKDIIARFGFDLSKGNKQR